MLTKFLVRLEWDSEYDGYVAYVPSLPGCVSQGKNEREALSNVGDAIQVYIESLKSTGQPIPSGDGDVYTIEVAA